jgi:hypothetical protein
MEAEAATQGYGSYGGEPSREPTGLERAERAASGFLESVIGGIGDYAKARFDVLESATTKIANMLGGPSKSIAEPTEGYSSGKSLRSDPREQRESYQKYLQARQRHKREIDEAQQKYAAQGVKGATSRWMAEQEVLSRIYGKDQASRMAEGAAPGADKISKTRGDSGGGGIDRKVYDAGPGEKDVKGGGWEGEGPGGEVVGREDIETAYERAVQHLEEGYARGRTDMLNMLAEVRELMKPYGDAGRAAIQRLSETMGGDFSHFQTSPGYEWRVSQGQLALERQAARRGDIGRHQGLTGAFAKELTRYGQEAGSLEFSNWWNQNLDLVQAGLSSGAIESAALVDTGNALLNAALDVGGRKGASAMSSGLALADVENLAKARETEEYLTEQEIEMRKEIAKMQRDLEERLQSRALSHASSESALSRSHDIDLLGRSQDWSTQMAERGYDVYRSAAHRQRQNDWWENIFGVATLGVAGLGKKFGFWG